MSGIRHRSAGRGEPAPDLRSPRARRLAQGLGAIGAALALLFHALPSLAQSDGKLANPLRQPGSMFGYGLAWLGTFAAVGAFGMDLGGPFVDTGLVFLFDSDPDSPGFGQPVGLLWSPELNLYDQFGAALANVGPHLVVGAPFAGRGPARAGGAYLFDGDPRSPTFGQPLAIFSNPRPGPLLDEFGFAVAAVGNHVLVGAYRDGTLADDAGAAYLFDGDPASPTFGELLHTFENPNPGVGDKFGVAVAGVSRGRALIGAFRDDVRGVDAGAAYLFDADSQSPTFGTLLHTFENPDPSPSVGGQNDEFGHSVLGIGDHVVVGAFRDDAGATDAGVAYLYDARPGSPSFGAVLHTFQNPTPENLENFGLALATSGSDLLVGAWHAHETSLYDGALYRFDADAESASFGALLQTLPNPSPNVFDSYGAGVAVRGRDVLVGAIGDDGGVGAAHVIRLQD